ncbi:MAG: hypothetical protein J6B04_05695, partial [Clostridia bacterium]|nr:hypothetical protein [Clostridia bacterium]
MEKIKARYLIPLEESKENEASISTKGLSFVYTTFSEEQKSLIKEQTSKFLLNVFTCYESEYDDGDGPSRSYDSNDFEIEDLISLSSPAYSTNEACADIIISQGEFKGVILKARRWGGNGWNNYDEWWYVILYTDGTMLGNNVSNYCFTGSSYSKDKETTYTL